METTGEHISASVMFQRTHARLWLLSSSWTVKSLVSSWYVSGKALALDWISLVVCRGEKECAQLGYLLTDSTDIVTFWSGFKTEEQSAEGDFFVVGLFNHANLIFILFFYDERLCHLPSCPVTLNHLITVDKAVFGGGSYSHVFTLHLYACRDGSCAIRGSSGVFFCGSWSSSSCLLIGSVWLLHHMGGEGWDGVMLVQYCIRPEVEIILFAIIAVKHLISHRTLSHTNIPALGFERRGKTSKNNSGVAVCMLIFLFKIWLWLFGLIMSYWCSHNGPKEPMNIINKRQHCAFYRKKKTLEIHIHPIHCEAAWFPVCLQSCRHWSLFTSGSGSM